MLIIDRTRKCLLLLFYSIVIFSCFLCLFVLGFVLGVGVGGGGGFFGF